MKKIRLWPRSRQRKSAEKRAALVAQVRETQRRRRGKPWLN